MGYSIYDYYGMANDLQNRYDAAKNAGRSSTTGATGLSFNNAPFQKPTTAPITDTRTQQQQSIYDTNETSTSGYDMTHYAGGQDMTPGQQNLAMALTMGWSPYGGLAQMAMNGFGPIPGLGDLTGNKVGGSKSWGGPAKMAGSYTIPFNMLGPAAPLGKAAFGAIIDLLTGNFSNKNKNTIGNQWEDPFLYSDEISNPQYHQAQAMSRETGVPFGSLWASNAFGGASYANEYAPGGIFNPDYDKYPDTNGIATSPGDTGNTDNTGDTTYGYGGNDGGWSDWY